MVKTEKLTTKKILDAVKHSAGVKSEIAKKLGVHRHTIDRYQKKYPTVRLAIEEEENNILDAAENNIFKAINAGDIDVSKWLLSRRGRSRGYSDKIDIEKKTNHNEPTVLKVIYEDIDVPEQKSKS